MLVLLVASGLIRLSRLNVVLGLVGITGILYLLPPSVWHRVLNPEAYDLHNATNLSWRFDLWAAAFRIGMENWMTGIGAGNLTYIIRYLDPTRFDGVWIAPHNEFLEKFMTMGVPGLAVFVAFLAIVLLQAVWLARAGAGHTIDPARRWFAVAAALTLLIGPAFALQVDAFHFPLKGWWLVAGLVLAAARLSRIATVGRLPRTAATQ
jgi:O-antigen ligase